MEETVNMINRQPQSVVYPYDPISTSVVNSMQGLHKSNQNLIQELNRTTATLSHSVESLRGDLHGNISYEQFMSEMLCQDELILGNQQFLQYDYVTFELLANTNCPVVPLKKNMSRGRLFLTNRRLIMLSNEGTTRTEVKPFGLVKPKPTKYSIMCEAGDAFHYQYLPLKNVRAVEFDAMIGASMTTYLQSQEPCCLLKMLSAFGNAICLRNWFEAGRVANPSLNSRTLKLSVDLPPWGNPCVVTVHVQPTVNLLLVKEFLNDLQKYSPVMKLDALEKHA